MRVGAVQLSEVTADGGRLTAGFHLSEDQVAVARLRRIADRCEPLRELCLSKRGIFRGPIFRRVFVEDPARGEPYVSSSDLMQAHVEPCQRSPRSAHNRCFPRDAITGASRRVTTGASRGPRLVVLTAALGRR